MTDSSQKVPLSQLPALVLGAGYGTRLLPLTAHVPKPVVPVLGRPLIGYPLIHLYAAGCTQVTVNAHHMPDRLQATLDAWVQRRLLRMKLRWSVELPEILGTGGALRKLEQRLCAHGGPILLLNGDSILGLDLPALVAAHERNRAEGAVATLLCVPRPDAAAYGAVRVDPGTGRVLDLAGLGRPPGTSDEQAAAATATIFCGVHVLEPEVVRFLPPAGDFSCIVRQGYAPMLQAGADVRAVLAPEDLLFHDVGKPGRYLDAQADLMGEGGQRAVAVADSVDPKEALFQEASYAVDASGRAYGSPEMVPGLAGAQLTPPFFFGPANRVEAGARIGPDATIGAGNVIGAGAVVRDAALWSGVEVGAGERLEGAIAAKLGGERRVLAREV
jgi:mannose-1-phosphate guanylyltransferase